jgi:hypothetical protein
MTTRPSVMMEQQDLVTAHSNHSAHRLFNTTASESSPTFGSPARLNATAPALAGSRDIPSARLIVAVSLWHSCFTWRCTVFGSDERESHVIGYGHGGLLSSLHIVSAYFSPYSFGRRAFLTLPRAKPDDTAAER